MVLQEYSYGRPIWLELKIKINMEITISEWSYLEECLFQKIKEGTTCYGLADIWYSGKYRSYSAY